MDVAAYTSTKAIVDSQNQAAVKVFKGAQEQKEAVLQILLGGIQGSAPRAPEQSGQNLNVTA